MIRYILGRAGSGKTEEVFSRIRELLNTDTPVILLVPEQFSFESEKALLHRFSVKDAAKIQVLSFSRLTHKVLQEVGGIATPVMDEVTAALMMSRALELHLSPENDNGDTEKSLYDSAYLRSLLSLSKECKQCGVSPLQLTLTAEQMEEGTLKSKVMGLGQVFELYDGLTAHVGLDPEDLTRVLAEKLPDSHLADGAHIFVDGFKGFTVLQLQILSLLMEKADITLAFCTDGQHIEQNTGLFAPVNLSLRQINRLAKERHIPTQTTVLTDNKRGLSPALKAVEQGVFATNPAVFEGDAEEIAVVACPDIFGECAAAARNIRRLLREEGYRAKDIAVIVRNLTQYDGILDNALWRENLPFYMDTPTDIYTSPLPALCMAALRICANGYRTEELLRILKTGLLPFDEVEIATLENYVFMWRIEGKRWGKAFTADPRGLVENDHSQDEALIQIENLRRRLIAPLKTLREQVAGSVDGKTLASALYQYLTCDKVAADEGIRRLHQAFTEDGDPARADTTARLWDEMMGLLDRFATIFEADRLPATRFAELFHLALGLLRLPSIPQGLDAVQVGSADHVRLQAPRAVFVLGANEGVFPAYPAEGNLLSDRERDLLANKGIALSADRLQKAAEERFFAYTAVSAPREKLYLSYVENSGNEAAYPSVLVETVRKIVPGHQEPLWQQPDGSDIESVADAFDRFAAKAREKSPYTAALQQAIREVAPTTGFAVLERVIHKEPFRIEPTTAKELFGTNMYLSASQTDSFYRCHFRYFCQYGMRLNSRRIADIDASLFGTFAHYVMEKLLPVYMKKEDLTAAARDIPEMGRDIHALLNQYVEEQLGGWEDKPARFRYLLSLVERTSFSLLWFTVNEMAQNRFKPADYELVIGKGGVSSPAFPLATHQGSVHIIGKIDRVDVYQREDTVFVRVVDYKTGSKEFKLSEIPYGINMQMLLYLFAICQDKTGHFGNDEVAPAGILYLPAKDVTLKSAYSPLDESRLHCLRMNGLLLHDPDVLSAMEQSGKGTFIPVQVKENVIQKNNNTVNKKDFELIRKLTEKLLVQMAESLLSGEVEAVPCGEANYLPCTYCDYRTVCGREDTDASVIMTTQKTDAVMQKLYEEEDGVDGET